MYDFLLAAHLLSAAAMVSAMVYFTAARFGVPVEAGHYRLAQVLVQAGAGLVLVFGIWLALYVDGYELWDFWILASIVLWIVSSATGAKSGGATEAQVKAGGPVTATRDGELLHWISIGAALAILVLMIWKPGA